MYRSENVLEISCLVTPALAYLLTVCSVGLQWLKSWATSATPSYLNQHTFMTRNIGMLNR